MRSLSAILSLVLVGTVRPGAADHGGPLGSASMSPLTSALAFAGLPGSARFDSLKVMASGNIAVATLNTGFITEISPAGDIVRAVKMPDRYPTNICFGGADMRTAYITLSDGGQLGVMQWPEPGLKLNFN